jgi:glyoxylase-like metal-dependent hydrolase (beta-lactamase superfamily II)
VYAYSPYYEGVDRVLANGETLRMGDRQFEVIHIPGHSDDSILLYNKEDGVLFAGDSPLVINSPGGSYNPGFVATLKALCRKNIRSIYFGHGDPLHKGVRETLKNTLENVLKSDLACAGGRYIA